MTNKTWTKPFDWTKEENPCKDCTVKKGKKNGH